MSSYKPVTALLRGLEVLRIVNRKNPVSLKEIHYETGFDKATIVRMLETLIHAGYISRNINDSTYTVLGRTLQLSAGCTSHKRTAEICRPIMHRLRMSVGWPSDFAVRDEESMVVVETTRDDGPMFFNRNPGFRGPMLSTSLGKVYTAFCADNERKALLSLIFSLESAKMQCSYEELSAKIMQVRTDGFAYMDDAYSRSQYNGAITAIAVPVMGEKGILGAINILMLREAISEDIVKVRYLPKLQDAADKISVALDSDNVP